MISSVTRLFLLRILPRRLVPLLTAVELALLVQRWRRSRQPAPGPRPCRGAGSGGNDPVGECVPAPRSSSVATGPLLSPC
jgi:hypothetical protein